VLIHGAPPSGYPSRCQGRRTVLCSPAIFRGGAHLTVFCFEEMFEILFGCPGPAPSSKGDQQNPEQRSE
jgi:hypothetical protein